ncbi:hypothetical protein SMICM17S_04791 [Streptomyces microflavus]
MRDAYHEELDSIGEGLVEMARLVGSAIGRATTSMLDADLKLAESVIAGDQKVDDLQHDLEARAIALLARRAAGGDRSADRGDLAADERRPGALGDLRQHVAKLARLRFPQSAVPHDLHATILEMGQLAQRLMAKAAEVIITKDVDLALQLEQDDDEMDLLHRTLFQHLMDDRWKHGIETAVDVTLLGRYYERFADHAVSVAKRVVYLVTGEHARSRRRRRQRRRWRARSGLYRITRRPIGDRVILRGAAGSRDPQRSRRCVMASRAPGARESHMRSCPCAPLMRPPGWACNGAGTAPWQPYAVRALPARRAAGALRAVRAVRAMSVRPRRRRTGVGRPAVRPRGGEPMRRSPRR